jgi:Tfp pilus assembly protein PilF
MGVIWLQKGNEASAIEEFKTAIKVDPANMPANLNLGYIALDSGDYALAKTAFEAVVKQYPGNTDAQMGYAISLRGLQDYDGATKIYDVLLAKDPSNRTIAYNAAMLYQKYTKNFDKAAKVLDEYQKGAGTLSPSDEFFTWKDSVEKDREIERKRQDEIKRLAKEKEEREKRQGEQLKKMADNIAATDAGMMAQMVIEQAKPVIAEKDLQMVGDMETFVTDSMAQLEAAKATCGTGAPADGGAPPPADGAAPAGAGTEPAPAPAPAPAPEPAPAPAPAPAPTPAPAPQ